MPSALRHRAASVAEANRLEDDRTVEAGRPLAAFSRDARRPAEQLENPLRGAVSARDSAENREALRNPRATSSAHRMNEISAPVVNRPVTMRLPPIQMARSAAHCRQRMTRRQLGARDLAFRELERPCDLAIVTRALGGFLREGADGADAAHDLGRRRAASACACCISAASAFTRRPSVEVAMTIGGTASSVSSQGWGDGEERPVPHKANTENLIASPSSSPRTC